MTGVVWLALDGVGHPLDAPTGSPWEQSLPTLRPLIDAGLALDAGLGVEGLPQSGTGQACWLTGQDAVRLMGEHFGPHPGPTLQRLLREASLPVRLKEAGATVALANDYAPPFLEALHRAQTGGRNRLGCIPYSFQAANLPFNSPEIPLLRASLGLNYQEPWTPFQTLPEVIAAGEALAKAAKNWDLIVCDLWLSDLLGHEGRNPVPPAVQSAAFAYLARLDALLYGLLEQGAKVVISSDHGNLENLKVKSHTLARVPFAGAGIPLGSPTNVVEAGQQLALMCGLR